VDAIGNGVISSLRQAAGTSSNLASLTTAAVRNSSKQACEILSKDRLVRFHLAIFRYLSGLYFKPEITSTHWLDTWNASLSQAGRWLSSKAMIPSQPVGMAVEQKTARTARPRMGTAVKIN
jgi:hypothetical protein